MNEFDTARCKLALKVIDAFLSKDGSLTRIIGDLRGLIILLAENEAELSRPLKDKLRILEQVRAHSFYRRSSAMSPESRASVKATLTEMNKLIREAGLDSDRIELHAFSDNERTAAAVLVDLSL
jgi:hypothetical protein